MPSSLRMRVAYEAILPGPALPLSSIDMFPACPSSLQCHAKGFIYRDVKVRLSFWACSLLPLVGCIRAQTSIPLLLPLHVPAAR